MSFVSPGFALPEAGVALEGGKEGCPWGLWKGELGPSFISQSSQEPLGMLNSHPRGPTDVGRNSKNQLATQS